MRVPYIPHTDADREEMLRTIGVEKIEDLFQVVPEKSKFPKLNLPPGRSETEVLTELMEMSEANADAPHYPIFLGAGAYYRYIPAVVDMVISRSEFYTAYTPYQPEISQGWLQAMFEYQSLVCDLTGMEAANISHYDGATALAEAVIMAMNVARYRRKKIVISPTVHPQYRAVARTYTQGIEGVEFVGDDAPEFDPEALKSLLDKNTVALIVQNPDFLGEISSPKEMQDLADAAHAVGALFVVAVDPISLGLLKPPGDYSADIVTAEGQSMGNPMGFGGPYLGVFAFRKKYVHKSSGRIVGQTVDAEGRRGFVLTLTAREQHIRRERASSNICSNQALNALATAAYLATMGKQGLRQVAELSYHKAHELARAIDGLKGYSVVNKRPFFDEFVVKVPGGDVSALNRYLLDEYDIIGGYDLGRDYDHLKGHMLLCATEMTTADDMDALLAALDDYTREEVA